MVVSIQLIVGRQSSLQRNQASVFDFMQLLKIAYNYTRFQARTCQAGLTIAEKALPGGKILLRTCSSAAGQNRP